MKLIFTLWFVLSISQCIIHCARIWWMDQEFQQDRPRDTVVDPQRDSNHPFVRWDEVIQRYKCICHHERCNAEDAADAGAMSYVIETAARNYTYDCPPSPDKSHRPPKKLDEPDCICERELIPPGASEICVRCWDDPPIPFGGRIF